MRRARGQAGQTSLLIVGFCVVLVMMAAVVTDASAAYLRRQDLDSLADGAALAAADGIQGRAVYVHGLGDHARIDPRVARGFALAYLASSGARRRYPGLTLSIGTTADRVVVRLAAPLRLPLHPPGWDGRTRVSATAATFARVSG